MRCHTLQVQQWVASPLQRICPFIFTRLFGGIPETSNQASRALLAREENTA
jgi:hypothetical protein